MNNENLIFKFKPSIVQIIKKGFVVLIAFPFGLIMTILPLYALITGTIPSENFLMALVVLIFGFVLLFYSAYQFLGSILSRMELSPENIRIRNVLGTKEIPWQDLTKVKKTYKYKYNPKHGKLTGLTFYLKDNSSHSFDAEVYSTSQKKTLESAFIQFASLFSSISFVNDNLKK